MIDVTNNIVTLNIISVYISATIETYFLIKWEEKGKESKFYNSNINKTGVQDFRTYYNTLEEAEEEKEKIINGTINEPKEDKFEEEFIAEEIAWMEGDEYNEGYYYNTITGKKINKHE